MLDLLQGLSGPLSLGAVVATAVLAIFSGRLIPISQLNKLLQIMEERLTREREISEQWKAAHDASEKARAEIAKQRDALLDGFKTVEQLILAIQRQLGDRDDTIQR